MTLGVGAQANLEFGAAGRVVRVSWTPVRVPFVAAFGTARGRLGHREGVLLVLTTEDGLVGYGEASPWPLFGQGDAADAARAIAELAPQFIGVPIGEILDRLARLEPVGPGAPAARCAIDLAAHDLLGKARGVPVAALLGGQRATVPVNAAIGAEAPELAAAAAHAAVAGGIGCIKVKVAAGTLAEDEARVAAVREAVGPGVALRLDANGGWTLDAAVSAIGRLERYSLELIEQPVAIDDMVGMAGVRRAVATPIAADEAVRDLASARRLVEAGACDLLVVKPMVVGGLGAGRAILELAAKAGLGAFVTTTVDFGVGIAGAHPACGLATASFLAEDFTGGQPEVRGSAMAIPPVPGLGVTLDGAAVRRYATGPESSVP